MSTDTMYGVSLGYVSIHNPGVIPFLLQATWFGQRVRESLWLVVSHALNTNKNPQVVISRFHTVQSIQIVSSKKFPFRAAVLCLSGDGPTTQIKLLVNLDRPDLNARVVILAQPLEEKGFDEFLSDFVTPS